MDSVSTFRIGIEDPPEYINIHAAQIALLSTFYKARKRHTMIRKLNRFEIINVGKGKKTIEELRSQLLSRTPCQQSSMVPSTSKAANGTAIVEYKNSLKVKPEWMSLSSIPESTCERRARPCPHCKCRRVRVVNPGRIDGRNIMECTNSDCLATIKFTSLPAGTLINPDGTAEEFSWYDLNAEEIFYPTSTTIKRLEESLKSAKKNQLPPKIGYDDHGCIVVRCPGQKELVKLL